jgi:hypothetical protein
MTNTADIIADAAALIATYNPALADCFRNEPFRRVNLALAFAAGFRKSVNDDIHPTASMVLRVAYLDRQTRVAA